MKRLIIFLFFFAEVAAVGQNLKSKAIATYLTDLNNDGKTDTLTITSSLKEKDFFNRISISLAGYGAKTFNAKKQWTLVDAGFLSKNKNFINSKYTYIKKNTSQTTILLFGYLYGGGGREEFSIINIENNTAQMVFDHGDDDIDVELPVEISSLGTTDRLYFVYKNFGEMEKFIDSPKGNIGSYNPYYVYSIDKNCQLNKALTKKYNQQHYVYAGLNFDNPIRIFYPANGGKPSVWKGKD